MGEVALTTALLLSAVASGQVAPSEQASTFSKIFAFDRQLAGESISLWLVGSDASGLIEVRDAFAGVGLSAEVHTEAELMTTTLRPSVVYLTREATTPEALGRVLELGALSIGPEASQAESGQVSVALGLQGGRTEIVVHLARLEQEKHDLSSQLLKLARVVRGASVATTESAVYRSPELVSFTAPPYPPLALRMQVEGTVLLRLQIDAEGSVTEVTLVEGLQRSGGINEAAVRAARRASFRPATRNGTPVESTYDLRIPFRLSN